MRSNVRVIAATHQNLEDRVRQGAFREDLFHRLNVIRLRLPALRERGEDIPTLARFFLQKSAKELGVDAKRISDAAMAQLIQFPFPGNVRQLENICHWITVMAPAQLVEVKDLPPELLASATSDPGTSLNHAESNSEPEPRLDHGPSRHMATDSLCRGDDASHPWLENLASEARRLIAAGVPNVWDVLTRQFESQLIQAALGATRGRRIESAQKLGIGRNTITRKIQELGL
jgi:two-component system nitrogen regulation response regulator GlnG